MTSAPSVSNAGRQSNHRRRSDVLLGLFVAVPAVGLAIFALLPGVYSGLISLTGETDPAQQVAAVFRHRLQQPLNTADMTLVAHSGHCPYGVNTFLEQEVEVWKLERSMEMMKEAGVCWIRQQIPWYDIEPLGKGIYTDAGSRSTWEKYDRIVDLAEYYGIKLLVRLDAPPNWSRADNSVYNRPPDNLNDYGDFVYAFASRYRGRVRYFQIWNEPNIYPEWGNRPVSATQYVDLLKVAYRRIKEVDPDAVVVAASLAPTLGTDDGYNQSDLTFLQEMYDAGAAPYFDIMSAMGYGLWTGPGDRRAEPSQVNFSRPQLIREIMVGNGDAAKGLWLSEVGWNALPDDFPEPATHGRVSEALQASYTAEAYQRIQAEWPWVGVAFYWHFRMVSDESRDQVVFYFRMVDPDFTPRPVYYAYRALATAPPVMGIGTHVATDWTIAYQGQWETRRDARALSGGYRYARAPAVLEFRFRGRDLDLIVGSSPTGGRVGVEIDGVAAPLLADGEIDLAGAEVWPVVVPLARGVRDDVHSVRLWATSGVAINGFAVRSGEAPLLPVMPALWLFGVALAGGALWRTRVAAAAPVAAEAEVIAPEPQLAPEEAPPVEAPTSLAPEAEPVLEEVEEVVSAAELEPEMAEVAMPEAASLVAAPTAEVFAMETVEPVEEAPSVAAPSVALPPPLPSLRRTPPEAPLRQRRKPPSLARLAALAFVVAVVVWLVVGRKRRRRGKARQ